MPAIPRKRLRHNIYVWTVNATIEDSAPAEQELTHGEIPALDNVPRVVSSDFGEWERFWAILGLRCWISPVYAKSAKYPPHSRYWTHMGWKGQDGCGLELSSSLASVSSNLPSHMAKREKVSHMTWRGKPGDSWNINFQGSLIRLLVPGHLPMHLILSVSLL